MLQGLLQPLRCKRFERADASGLVACHKIIFLEVPRLRRMIYPTLVKSLNPNASPFVGSGVVWSDALNWRCGKQKNIAMNYNSRFNHDIFTPLLPDKRYFLPKKFMMPPPLLALAVLPLLLLEILLFWLEPLALLAGNEGLAFFGSGSSSLKLSQTASSLVTR